MSNICHLDSGKDQINEAGEEGPGLHITRGLPWSRDVPGCFFFMWLLNYPCATLQCQMFEETIIADRAEKEAKRRKLERDALELKSILKVKGNETEAVLLHQQLGVIICTTGCVQAENGLRKLAGTGWHKQGTD